MRSYIICGVVLGLVIGSFVGAYLAQLPTKNDLAEIRQALGELEKEITEAEELTLLRNEIRKHWDDYLNSDYSHEYSETDRRLIAMAIDGGRLLTPDVLNPKLFWDITGASRPFGLEFPASVPGAAAWVVVVASIPQSGRVGASHVLDYVVYGYSLEDQGLYRISEKSLWRKDSAWGPWLPADRDTCVSDIIKIQASLAFCLL